MLGLRFSVFIGLTLVAGEAVGQPKICGNQAALGSWNVDQCPQLKDDGAGADEAAGDGIYSVEISLDPTSVLEYKLLPQGTWALALGQQGTCDGSGNPTGNDTSNLRILRPDVSRPVRFYLDTRTLSDPGAVQPPGNRSFGDTLMTRSPSGECPRWFVVGDFQNLVGVNGTAVPLSLLRPGVLVGKHTASKSLGSGWKWKVVEQADTAARELGGSGWAYAPCQAPAASASQPVSPGDTVYFVIDTRTGRLRSVVSNSPLDGFAPDGTALCPPVVDMASPLSDLAGSVADLAGGSVADLTSAGTADGGSDKPLPGIHCDCQLASTPKTPPPVSLTAVPLLVLLRRLLRSRRSRQ